MSKNAENGAPRRRKTPDKTRSAIMAAVKSKNTRPEMIVRKRLFAEGLRYRLHAGGLPGRPDLVFPRHRAVVFVHGCFWHGHDCARGARTPKTNADYWRAKIARNVERDARQQDALSADGWRVFVIWECGLRDWDAQAMAAAIRAR